MTLIAISMPTLVWGSVAFTFVAAFGYSAYEKIRNFNREHENAEQKKMYDVVAESDVECPMRDENMGSDIYDHNDCINHTPYDECA